MSNAFEDLLGEIEIEGEGMIEFEQSAEPEQPAGAAEPTAEQIEAVSNEPTIGMVDDLVDQTELAREVQKNTVAVRLAKTTFYPSKKLDDSQRAKSALPHNANADALRIQKRLIDTRNEAMRNVRAVQSQATFFWKMATIPFVEKGVRLLPQSKVAEFEETMDGYKRDLARAVNELDSERVVLIDSARASLGDLFDEADYPSTFVGRFTISHSIYEVSVPNHLKEMHPEIYERQAQLLRRRFETSVAMFENEIADELRRVTAKLAESLKPGDDGKVKRFHKSAVENVNKLFDRFSELDFSGRNGGAKSALGKMLDEARNVVDGKTAKSLKGDATQRNEVGQVMERLSKSLESMLEDAPIRAARLAD